MIIGGIKGDTRRSWLTFYCRVFRRSQVQIRLVSHDGNGRHNICEVLKVSAALVAQESQEGHPGFRGLGFWD